MAEEAKPKTRKKPFMAEHLVDLVRGGATRDQIPKIPLLTQARRVNIFTKILYDALVTDRTGAKARQAYNWYIEKAKKMASGVTATDIKKPFRVKKGGVFGRMYFYAYDPKHKKTLPYYDTFPLIFMVQKAPGGFYGINFHYLPAVARVKLLSELYSVISNKRFDETTKLSLTLEILSSVSKSKLYKPCVKHYLINHVKSYFFHITAVEWPIAIMLPVAKFQKATDRQVWQDSMDIVSGKISAPRVRIKPVKKKKSSSTTTKTAKGSTAKAKPVKTAKIKVAKGTKGKVARGKTAKSTIKKNTKSTKSTKKK